MKPEDLPINPAKIQRNLRTVPEFIQQVVRGRNCKARCNGCDTNWARSTSEYVHAAARYDKPDIVHFCDDCLQIITADV